MGLASLRSCSAQEKRFANILYALTSLLAGEVYVFRTVEQSGFELYSIP